MSNQLSAADSLDTRSLKCRLSTDHDLLSFLWAWWKVGKGTIGADDEDYQLTLNPSMPSPLCRFCKVCYQAGRDGHSWPIAVGLLDAIGDPGEPSVVPQTKPADNVKGSKVAKRKRSQLP